ncbi:MAG: molybdenum cofactor biosynthesis protein MoaE [Chloroflexi bacterium]|nr:molybdenum cofactor biosynthesis protein MoaE [Chloroflexota bacterium]
MHVRVRLFASLRELTGCAEEELQLVDGSSVQDAWTACVTHWPALEHIKHSVAIARNRVFTQPDAILSDGDELALLPPVSGGAGIIELTHDPLSVDRLVASIRRPSDGGLVVFNGIVRNHSEGRSVQALDYQAYPEMALEQLSQVAREVEGQWPAVRIAMAHRLGHLAIGEVSVIVAVSAPHRPEAFAACHFGIDRLKEIVPIWKKEFFDDDEAHWPGGSVPDPRAVPR